jgi:hypothetical protein
VRFYADVIEKRASSDILEELNGLAVQLVNPLCRTIPGKALGIARDGLILSGMLEQALADDPELSSATARTAQRIHVSASALSDWWADRVVAPGNAAGEGMPTTLDGSAVPLSIVVPEGYLFYALFPELYAQVGRDMARESNGVRSIVVGVRSIGTSLSAALAAGLRSAGCSVVRHTVRPIGDPFDRKVVVSPEVQAEWRAIADRGIRFVAVDEGPGLSGSSLAALVQAFHRAGVSPDRIAIVCANPPGSLPQAGPEVRAIWQTTAVHSVQLVSERLLSECIPTLLSFACNARLQLDRDLSWGAWREKGASLLPLFERRKLLLHDQKGGQVLAKFVGFGAWGAHKAAGSRRIAERGLAPPFRNYGHGFLVQDWVGEALPDTIAESNGSELLDAAATYYAGLYRDAGQSSDAIDLAGLATTVEGIRDAWFGVGDFGDLGSMLRAAAAATPRACQGDQRPEPIEWRRSGNRILKCDTADHYLDHSWARRQDIAFDLAGFMDEWRLDPSRRTQFMAAYTRESGDSGASNRLPFFRCVYHAHRLAMFDTAYHAGMDDGEASIAKKRQSEGEWLAIALAAQPATRCV